MIAGVGGTNSWCQPWTMASAITSPQLAELDWVRLCLRASDCLRVFFAGNEHGTIEQANR